MNASEYIKLNEPYFDMVYPPERRKEVIKLVEGFAKLKCKEQRDIYKTNLINMVNNEHGKSTLSQIIIKIAQYFNNAPEPE